MSTQSQFNGEIEIETILKKINNQMKREEIDLEHFISKLKSKQLIIINGFFEDMKKKS